MVKCLIAVSLKLHDKLKSNNVSPPSVSAPFDWKPSMTIAICSARHPAYVLSLSQLNGTPRDFQGGPSFAEGYPNQSPGVHIQCSERSLHRSSGT